MAVPKPSGLSAGTVAGARFLAGREPLSRDLVLRAALTLLDADGAERLSMRRLAGLLGRDPMALYRHVATRGELLDGIVEHVLGSWTIHGGAPDWAAELRRASHALRTVALAHPHVVPLLVTRPLATPLGQRPLGVLAPLEGFLELMTGAGLSPVEALRAYRGFTGTINGHLLEELQEVVTSPAETDPVLRLGLWRLPLEEFPLVRSVAAELAGYDGSAALDRALDMVLDRLANRLANRLAGRLEQPALGPRP